MNKKIQKKYEQVFKGKNPPQWISISAAFSYALALVADKYNVPKNTANGHIDITSPLETYDVPDAAEIAYMDNKIKKNFDKKYLWDTDRAIFLRLADGSLKCEGRMQESRRVAITSSHPPDEYFCGKDEFPIVSGCKTIDRSFWKDQQPFINYKDASVVICEDDPDNINEDIEPDCNASFHTYGMSRGDYYVWKKEWVNLEVCTLDLLEITEKLFDEYCERNNLKNQINNSQLDVMTSQGENRFFYSKSVRGWIIEFHDKVSFLNYNEESLIAKTVQYLLNNGNLDIEKVIKMCNWVSVDQILAFGEIHLEGSLPKTGDLTLNQIRDKIKKLEKQQKLAVNESEKETIQGKINELKKYLINGSDSKGKPRTENIHIRKIKARVKKRLKDFKTKIKSSNKDLYDHLEETIKPVEHEGIVYQSNVKWITKDNTID